MDKGAPNFGMVANSYGIASFKFETSADLENDLEVAFKLSRSCIN